jgi:hypothetical protein
VIVTNFHLSQQCQHCGCLAGPAGPAGPACHLETETEGLQVGGQPGQYSETLSPKRRGVGGG